MVYHYKQHLVVILITIIFNIIFIYDAIDSIPSSFGNCTFTLLGSSPTSGTMNVETTGYDVILATAYKYINNAYVHGSVIYSPCASSSTQYPNAIWEQSAYNTAQQVTTITISYSSNRHWISSPYGAKVYVYGLKTESSSGNFNIKLASQVNSYYTLNSTLCKLKIDGSVTFEFSMNRIAGGTQTYTAGSQYPLLDGFPNKGTTQIPITGQINVNGTMIGDVYIMNSGNMYFIPTSTVEVPVGGYITGTNLTYSIA